MCQNMTHPSTLPAVNVPLLERATAEKFKLLWLAEDDQLKQKARIDAGPDFDDDDDDGGRRMYQPPFPSTSACSVLLLFY